MIFHFRSIDWNASLLTPDPPLSLVSFLLIDSPVACFHMIQELIKSLHLFLPINNVMYCILCIVMSRHFPLGKLTVQEFKVALKRLRFKDEKKWTLKMIRRLFQDHDTYVMSPPLFHSNFLYPSSTPPFLHSSLLYSTLLYFTPSSTLL